MQPSPRTKALRGYNFSQQLADTGWYHSFELPDGEKIEGYNTVETQRNRYLQFPLPADLTGRRVLDIGAWDGWFSFEAERCGAGVVAVDCVEIPNFRYIHRKLGSKVDYRILDFYELPGAGLGAFDYVFFLGVLYHLKHPLLAAEIVCALTTETAIVESFVIDPGAWQDHRNDIPHMEFYETFELGGQLDNWIGPSVGCLLALFRAAGFARVELIGIQGEHALVACHRKWEPVPDEPSCEAPRMVSACHSRTAGINFSSRKEEYLTCWFLTERTEVPREDLRLEVGPFGVPALFAQPEGERWMANFRLPPGLAPGWHEVRLRFAGSRFSEPARIALDLPLEPGTLSVREVTDGVSWRHNEVAVADRGFLACWVRGLPANADVANTELHLGDARLKVEWVGEAGEDGARQVNAEVPASVPKGRQRLRIACAGASIEVEVSVI